MSYAICSLTRSEKNYSAFKLFFAALKWAVTEKFSDYLMNSEFIFYRDNYPFTYIPTGLSANLVATGQRWASALGHFNFKIICKSTLNNKDVDTMSRHLFEKVNEDKCVQIENGAV